jgi:hypothetical protein
MNMPVHKCVYICIHTFYVCILKPLCGTYDGYYRLNLGTLDGYIIIYVDLCKYIHLYEYVCGHVCMYVCMDIHTYIRFYVYSYMYKHV